MWLVRRIDDIEPRPERAQPIERRIKVGADQLSLVGGLGHGFTLAPEGGPWPRLVAQPVPRVQDAGAMLYALLTLLGIAILIYGVALVRMAIARRVWPGIEAMALGAIVNFFD